jgi:hypothetical protein
LIYWFFWFILVECNLISFFFRRSRFHLGFDSFALFIQGGSVMVSLLSQSQCLEFEEPMYLNRVMKKREFVISLFGFCLNWEEVFLIPLL